MTQNIKKIIDDRVYPCFDVRRPNDVTNPITKYFRWDLSDEKYLDYPDHMAYFLPSEDLSKFLRLRVFSHYEKAVEFYTKEGWFIDNFRFKRVHREIYEWNKEATMEELNTDPRNDTEWR